MSMLNQTPLHHKSIRKLKTGTQKYNLYVYLPLSRSNRYSVLERVLSGVPRALCWAMQYYATETVNFLVTIQKMFQTAEQVSTSKRKQMSLRNECCSIRRVSYGSHTRAESLVRKILDVACNYGSLAAEVHWMYVQYAATIVTLSFVIVNFTFGV